MGRARQAGVTLVELMIVVAIVAVLASTAVIAFKSDPVGDGARLVNAVLQEARRTAIAGGPVRENVAEALGIKARARVEFSTENDANIVTLYELVEDPLPAATASWEPISRAQLPRGVRIYAVANQANTLGGEAMGPALGAGRVTKDFYPNGSSDAMTVYLGHRHDEDAGDKYRVFVLPLSGLPTTGKHW